MELETSEIQQKILAFDCSHVVITGGEPLLQQVELTPLWNLWQPLVTP
jgi:organic radical activating enzyme|tara:strand:+ start:304 stop:447 length:144 start_codon:yes stop_codon:yes gene_type:complete